MTEYTNLWSVSLPEDGFSASLGDSSFWGFFGVAGFSVGMQLRQNQFLSGLDWKKIQRLIWEIIRGNMLHVSKQFRVSLVKIFIYKFITDIKIIESHQIAEINNCVVGSSLRTSRNKIFSKNELDQKKKKGFRWIVRGTFWTWTKTNEYQKFLRIIWTL